MTSFSAPPTTPERAPPPRPSITGGLSQPPVEDIPRTEVLCLKPGDVFVVHMSENATVIQCNYMKSLLGKKFPKQTILVLCGTRLTIARQEQS